MTLLFAVLACKGDDGGSGFELELFEDAHLPESVTPASAVGFGALSIPVRVVNAYGASVGGDSVTVELSGPGLGTSSQTLDPDALGLAVAVVGEGAAQAVTATVTGSSYGNSDPVDSYLLGPGRSLDLLPSFLLEGEPSHLVAAPGGMGVVIGSEVWWQPAVVGAAPQRMLSVPSELEGAWGSDLDQDGATDLVVWNAEAVYLLRGHGSGGYAWGAGFQPTTGAITWVAVGDVDDNGVRDIAVVYEASGVTGVSTLLNDGLWRFTARSNLELTADPIVSAAVGRFAPEGASGLAVHTSSGNIDRYGWIDGRWVSQGQDLSVKLSNGLLMPSHDLNGDLVDELVLVAPDDGTEAARDLLLIDMNDGPRTYALAYESFHMTFADLTGDLVDDLVMVDRGSDGPRVGVITQSDAGFNHRTLALLRDTGPVAAGRLESSDLLADVAVGLDHLQLFPGAENESGWTLAEPSYTSWATDALAPVRVGDWDADGVAEVLTVRERDDGDGEAAALTRLAFSYDPHSGELGLIHQDSVVVDGVDPDATAVGLDLAICDDRAWLLVDDGGQSVLYGVALQGHGYLDAVADPVALSGQDLVACGLFEDGDVAVSGEDGDVDIYAFGESDEPLGGATLGDVFDIVGQRADGEPAQVVGCATAGCSVHVVDLDGDGTEELVKGGESLEVEAFGTTWTAAVSGVAGSLDIDGDGQRDASVTDLAHGDIAVLATLAGGLGPVLIYRWEREVGGPLGLVDIDRDGSPEVVAEGVNGSLVHTPVD